MANNPSVRAFKCPSCGGPLEPEVGTLTMKCPYCGSTIIIPESLRTPPPSSGPSMGEVFQFGLNGVDLNQIVGNAMHLPQAISLAQQGRVDEAADMYSKITGMEHADALAAVKDMASGHAVSLTPGRQGVTWQQVQPSYSAPINQTSAPAVSSDSFSTGPKSGGRSCGLLIGIIAVVAILIVGLVAGGLYFFSGSKSPAAIIPLGFANQTLAFGSEGIGAGMFQDPRSIGVDGNGNMTVADFQDGRVQTFDPSGKLASSFSLTQGNKKVYVTTMGVGRDGTIYICHDRRISVYKPNGTKIKDFGDVEHGYDSVVVGGDGKLYGITNQETIVRLKPDGTVDLQVPDTFTQITGDMDIDTHLAADGLGNMYILGSFHYLVLKYTPDGKFVDQFGGKAKDAAVAEPGKFKSPLAIAVDGYGRIYVSDFGDIQVFDADGTYSNRIGLNDGAVFGMAFDDQNHLYVVTNQNHVMKFNVQAPATK
jgi:sugar lactone lactonase YvrE/predicted RNA-binding Zn-ribbon protein involved in translation (DUF1610 family)